MIRFAPLLLLVALFAGPALGLTTTCNAGLIAAGYCKTGEVLFAWDLPDSVADEFEAVVEAEAVEQEWLQVLGTVIIARRQVCTAADVTLGVCSSAPAGPTPEARSSLSIAMPSARMDDLADWLRDDAWDTITCRDQLVTQIPAIDIPAGVTAPSWALPVQANPVSDADCTSGQIGQTISNPKGRRPWAVRYVRNYIRRAVLWARYYADLSAVESGLDTAVDVEE